MKAAKEWLNQVAETVATDMFIDTAGKPGSSTETLIKQIQLDAMKEGMRRAEIIAFNEMVGLKDPFEFKNSIRKAILTAAEQLTTKDL